MKKKGLGRRYSKHLPKLTIPLEDKAAVYKLPKSLVYEKHEDQKLDQTEILKETLNLIYFNSCRYEEAADPPVMCLYRKQ